MSSLKKFADSAYKAGENRQAIELYTRALYHPPSMEKPSTEDQRALSADYTTSDSPKGLTRKLYRRKAVVLLKLFRIAPEADDEKLKDELARGLNLRPGSREMRKVLLFRAVVNRGLIISNQDRDSFPFHPRHLTDGSESVTHFTRSTSRQPLTEETPISVLFSFFTPYLRDPQKPGQKFVGNSCLPESMPIGMLLQNWIFSYALSELNLNGNPDHLAWTKEAVEIESEEKSKVFLSTQRGRLLEIPRKTLAGEIYKGAKWPRTKEDGPMAFKDHITAARVNPDLVDGAAFRMGYSLDLYIVPNRKIKDFVRNLEDGFRASLLPVPYEYRKWNIGSITELITPVVGGGELIDSIHRLVVKNE
ncbi:hypothetical protein ABKN59_009071 [Abortiporus biennis]